MKEIIDILRKDLIKHEGVRLKVYNDHLGNPTIGVGRLLSRGISYDEAMYMLDNDIKTMIKELGRYIWFDALDTKRKIVVINMAFNMGVPNVNKFQNMIDYLKDKNYRGAAIEMLKSKWAKQVPNRALELAELMRS